MKRLFLLFVFLTIAMDLITLSPIKAMGDLVKTQLPINWSDGQQIRFRFIAVQDQCSGTPNDSPLAVVNYTGGVTVYNGDSATFPPKGNKVLISDELYGNKIAFVHSGNDPYKPLPAECLRSFIEGGGRNQINVRNKPDVRQERIASLQNSYVLITQGDTQVIMMIAAIVNVSHKALNDFDADITTVLPKLINLSANTPAADTFQEAMFSQSQYVMYMFCGWAPDADYPGWYEYTKWVLLLKPLGQTPQ